MPGAGVDAAPDRGSREDVTPADVTPADAVARAAGALRGDAPLPDGLAIAVERHGIVWQFSRPARVGRYATGDWWVLGPVELVAITPPSARDGDGRVRNGSMVNPSPRATSQGYDSAMLGGDAAARFDPRQNAAADVTAQRPLRLEPHSSLVSTISEPAAGQVPQLTRCAVLTCVATPPRPGAFRPPYCGTDKRSRWASGDLDMTALATLERVPGAPDVADLVQRLERTWLDHLPGRSGTYLHPREHMPEYGSDLADLVATAALTLQLDLPASDKRALAVALTQLGIDVYGVVAAGGRFLADGGNGSGRKFPLLLAGALLHDEELLRCASPTAGPMPFAFAEDAQTFYVRETSAAVFNGGHGGYQRDDEGMPEWGNRHHDQPEHDRKAWTADPYRRCCTANVWHGYVLAARIMGLRDAWDHPALFDYVDRYMQVETAGHWMRSRSAFCERMWDRYRPRF